MINTASHYASRALALGGVVLALLLVAVIASPQGAQAEGWTNYCNNQTLAGRTAPPYQWMCVGAARTTNGLMGEGDQHSVCVWEQNDYISRCTAGPGAWVYNPGDGVWAFNSPIIENQGNSANVVHAVAWTL